ncbi:MAG: NADH-quinone oxidoreductase subunit NuoG [candidate division Zixibacteria bacterium]|nr:NADH-quinone oxidoreductase subunit NuoG [candidate division Zixibacteria bacterium]
MADQVTLTIEGREVTVPKGSTILDAATRLGIVIPTFCWDPRLRSIAACRMCLVEVEKSPKLVTACAAPAMDGMVVKVFSDKAVNGRKAVMEFQLVNHPLDCPTCDKGGECELQNHSFSHGPGQKRTSEPRNRVIFDGKYVFDEIPIGPVIWYNSNRCIKCYKCTRLVKEIAGDADLGAFNRGYKTILHRHKNVPFKSEFSGNTVQYCPVGALVADSFRFKERTWMLEQTPSVCHLCGDGCNTALWHQGQKLFRIYARWNNHVEDGLICDRGRFGGLYADDERRLQHPQIRKEGKLVEVSWNEAIRYVADMLENIMDKHGGESIGFIGNEMLSNEEAYLFNRFARQVIGTNNLDFRFEDRHLPSKELNFHLLSIMSDRVPYIDFKKFDNILFVGADSEVRHPVLTLWVKRAIYSGASRTYAAYHRKTDYNLHPAESIEYFPQGEYNFLLCLYKALKGDDIKDITSSAGVRAEDVEKWAEDFKNGKTLIFAGEDVYNNPRGTENIQLIEAIRDLLGQESKVNILFDGANYIGNILCGATPGILPFGVDNIYDNRKALADSWGAEKLSDSEGMNTAEMLNAAAEGKLKALFILGADPVGFYPGRGIAEKAMKKAEFKVVCETFLTETGKSADVVLPLAAFPEYEGTLISTEGRLQSFQKAYETAYTSAEGWRIMLRIMQKLGFEEDYNGPEDIWNEIGDNSEIFSNISHKGVSFRGLLIDMKFDKKRETDISGFEAVEAPKPPPEYPLILTYGTSVYQKRHLTHYAADMEKIEPGARIYMNTKNANSIDIHDNDTVRVSSGKGSLTLKLTTDQRVRPGTVFIPTNFIEAEFNTLLDSKADLTFVKVEKL